ncbi:MAG: type I-C CRISPR-associated protein Cas5c [Actinomycetota bacterium]|nr:type I-C CRISPR-associated protein Cas5c [Actinomycetota bacterium]
MNDEPSLEVKVWGDFACFTRPEFGAERVSYEVMTPSAARGVLEAIFWKPEMRWLVREIRVLKPIRRFSILRNEMNSLQTERRARSGEPYYADEDRAQRHTLCLRDVAYVIRADIELKPHANDHPAKYRDQFRRRVKRGQCFHQPYLGTRECAAFFAPPEGNERPIDLTDDLGLMLFDLAYAPVPAGTKGALRYVGHGAGGPAVVEGDARPEFFRARLDGGVLRVPPEAYEGGGA